MFIESEIATIKEKLVGIFKDIKQIDGTLIPKYGEDFEDAEHMLEHELFDIVVCGEVKKGKSSFINAVIGEDILPTNTKVATSQVFRIINKTEKRFFLVFTNGDRKEISQEELSRYGSQVDADAEGDPMFASHALDFIEIWYPIEFLPKQIAIVDTPGIGALYAAHERITRQYLQKASAVVFIVDPQNPITDPEVKFVEKALSVTKHITFVMTKIDNYDKDYVIEMKSRDEEILNEKFKQEFKILPMSSTELAAAAKEDIDVLKEDSLSRSLFEPVRDNLLTLVYQTMGFSRNVYVFNVLNNYNNTVMGYISDQVDVLSKPSNAKALVAQKEQLKNDFVNNWGPKGNKQAEIAVQLNDHITSLHNGVTNLFSQAGPIYTKFNGEIEEVGLLDMEEYGKSLPRRLQDEFGQSLRSVMDTCHDGMQRSLATFNQELQDENSNGYVKDGWNIPAFHAPSLDMMQYFNHFRNGVFSAGFACYIATIISIPVAGWVVGGLVVILAGASIKKEKELRGRAELKKFVHEALMAIQQDICTKPFSDDEPISMLQKVERDLKGSAQAAIKTIYEREKENVEKQLALLSDQMKKEGEEREKALKSVTKVRAQWKPIHENLVGVREKLENLDRQFSKETA